jgi:hypothetical protein
MVELIQLVDQSLARHGFGALPETGQNLSHETPLELSAGSSPLAETTETKGLSTPNWQRLTATVETSCPLVTLGLTELS